MMKINPMLIFAFILVLALGSTSVLAYDISNGEFAYTFDTSTFNGTAYDDLSTNNNDLILYPNSNASSTTGYVNEGVFLSGLEKNFEYLTPPITANTFSYCVAINNSDTNNLQGSLIETDGLGSTGGLIRFYIAGNEFMYYYAFDGTNDEQWSFVNYTLANDTYNHICIVQDDQTYNAYLNGVVLDKTLDTPDFNLTINFSDGQLLKVLGSHTGDPYFEGDSVSGTFDEAYFYDGALTQQDVTDIYDYVSTGTQYPFANPLLIDSCRVIDASGEYNITANITGNSGSNNACLSIEASGVTINAYDYEITATGTQPSAIYVDGVGDNFVLNNGVLTASSSEGNIKFGNGVNGLTINGTTINANGLNARAIRQTAGTITNLYLDGVTINANSTGADAVFLISGIATTIKDSYIYGADQIINSGTGFSSGNIYGNVFTGGTLTFGTGTNNNYYNNTLNNTGVITFTSLWNLNDTNNGNTWTTPTNDGYSNTCLNNGSGICETPYNNGVSYDYLAVALSPYCTSVWECVGYDTPVCLIDDTSTASCNAVNDTNACGRNYTGDYTEFVNDTGVCDYCTPDWVCSGYVNTTCVIFNGTGTLTQTCNQASDNNGCYAITTLPSDQYLGNYTELGQEVLSCEAGTTGFANYGIGLLIALIPILFVVGFFLSSDYYRKKETTNTTKVIMGVTTIIIVLVIIALL